MLPFSSLLIEIEWVAGALNLTIQPCMVIVQAC